MSELPDAGPLWVERMIGAAAGSLIALIYLVPKSRQEAASRLLTSLVTGLVFAPEAGVFIATRLGLASELTGSETMLSGAAAAGFFAWWALGMLARMARRAGAEPPSGTNREGGA